MPDQPPGPFERRLPPAGIAFAVLFIAGLIVSTALSSRTFPSPYESEAVIKGYFADNTGQVRALGLLHTLSALALAAFTAGLAGRVRDRAGSLLALAAGSIAAVFLLVSGMCSVALVADGTPDNVVTTLHELSFVAGGAMHVVFLGTLVAVATASLGLPRALAVLGWISAALSLVAAAALVSEPASFLLPLGRFTALLWSIVTSVWLLRRAA
ncbi:hypothetical protein [Actinomadura roseirufa]|uniref:hypothetical protein n=1 Tax=Actinomadura roseirufa TaxID=2094049 RepID=UPI0010418D23|nr:hypothetical protein [Actinomadura roseirufa]